MEVSLLVPGAGASRSFLEIHCYLDQGFVGKRDVTGDASRQISLIVAPLRPDVYEWTNTDATLRGLVVNTALLAPDGVAELAASVLQQEAARVVGSPTDSTILTHNFARDFPLHNPSLIHYFMVHRPSVRRLLQAFETRNGIRLWCSVRRERETTSCLDLGPAMGSPQS